nr:MAG TPA: hypothetical protein [Caudoviricetes sp.]
MENSYAGNFCLTKTTSSAGVTFFSLSQKKLRNSR